MTTQEVDHSLGLAAAYLFPGDHERRDQLLATIMQIPDGTDLTLSLDRLEAAEILTRTAKAIQTTAVLDARALGATWEQIGDALGLTKQAAQQRYRSFA